MLTPHEVLMQRIPLLFDFFIHPSVYQILRGPAQELSFSRIKKKDNGIRVAVSTFLVIRLVIFHRGITFVIVLLSGTTVAFQLPVTIFSYL